MVTIPGEGLAKRQYGYDCYRDVDGSIVCPNSAWYDWVRWVVLAIIIVLFILLFMACSCYSARRRRRAGLQPYYGTGWAGGQHYPPNQAGSRYAHYGQPWQQPAPPYSQQPPPTYDHNGYFGQGGRRDESGIELESPRPVYGTSTHDAGYEPPVGPPPGKKGDGIIR